ncbi:MAG: argininosuccinate lyase [Chloroflexota bacterium]|nr:argininosuccinate lyase [Chloroflexota bacterium]
MKAWGGRFAGSSDLTAASFGRSLEVDRELALDDIQGSLAHVRGLGRAGLLSADEVQVLSLGLDGLRDDVVDGSIVWDPELEDVHLNLESALEARVGHVARKLHTGRSRNDQVATDLRLWLRRTTARTDEALLGLEQALVGLAERHAHAVMPASTHTQPAQPVLLAHHLLAYVEMLERDRSRFADAQGRADRSPLGSGAVAGAGFSVDREAVAQELGFGGVTRNSIDAVGDRDFVVETLSAAALTMVHLSRLAEEVAWWSSPAYGWVRVSDAFSTGSSMMPHKRNPDPVELVRGRAARMAGHLLGVLTMLKGLPAGYQRDLQEDKAPLFDAMRTLEASLRVMTGLVASLAIDEARMAAAAGSDGTTATAVADTLVDAGVTFRSAHHLVGRLVLAAERSGSSLAAIDSASLLESLSASDDPMAQGLAGDPTIAQRLRAAATVEAALARCDVVGGTARPRVQAELTAARERLGPA